MSRAEQLYEILFDVIDELTEHDTADAIFDRIVENFAYTVEETQTRERIYTELLTQFRKNDISDIPEALPQDMAGMTPEDIDLSSGDYDIYDSQGPEDDRPINWEALEAKLSPSTKNIMSGSPDKFLDFLKGIDFPDRLGS